MVILKYAYVWKTSIRQIFKNTLLQICLTSHNKTSSYFIFTLFGDKPNDFTMKLHENRESNAFEYFELSSVQSSIFM